MNTRIIVTTNLSDLSGGNENCTNEHHSVCCGILSGHITNTNMNDMPCENYQKSLVLENWTPNIDVCPSTETQSCKSDGTCSENSIPLLRLSSDTEDSEINGGNTCDIFDNDYSRDTIMCVDKTDSNKNCNMYDMLTIKNLKENVKENDSIPSLTDVNNWKELFQTNDCDQYVTNNSISPIKDSINRATVVKLTALKDDIYVNDQGLEKNYKDPLMFFSKNFENADLEKLHLSPTSSDEKYFQENETVMSNYNSLSDAKRTTKSIKTNIKKKCFIKQRKSFYNKHYRFPFNYKSKRRRTKQKYAHKTDSKDHNYSCSELFKESFMKSKISEPQESFDNKESQENETTLECTNLKLSENSMMKSIKIETDETVDTKHNSVDSNLPCKLSGERQMPILITYDDDSNIECPPSSPQMPTLIPFTSENEHPLVVFNEECTSSYHYKQNLSNDNIYYNTNTSNKEMLSSPSVYTENQWCQPNDYFTLKQKIRGNYNYINKFSRKARKSFPRSRCYEEIDFINSARTSGASNFNSESRNEKMKSSPNFQPVVLLERIKSESSSKQSDKESLENYREEFCNYFNYSNSAINNSSDPEIDIIDGVEFYSFVSEQNLQRFVKTNHNLCLNSNDNCNDCENQKKRGAIVPTKTNDITRIKGWRNKLFVQEPCPPPPSYISWEHLMYKDLSNDERLDILSEVKSQVLQEDNSSKNLMLTKIESNNVQNCAKDICEDKKIFIESKPQAETKINDDKLLKNNVSKTSRSAFMSNLLDDFLKTRSKLSINMLTQYNPNILSIPENSPILSVGSLRKTEESLPSETKYSYRQSLNNNRKVARMVINKIIKKNNEIITENSNDTILSEILETSPNNSLKQNKSNSKDNITFKNKLHNKNNMKQQKFKEAGEETVNTDTSMKNIQKIKSFNYHNIDDDDILKSHDDSMISLLNKKIFLIQHTLWNNAVEDYKKVRQFFDELNRKERNFSYSQNLRETFPIIEESCAKEAIRTLITSENLHSYRTLPSVLQYGKKTKTKYFVKSKSENKYLTTNKRFLSKSDNKYLSYDKSKLLKKLENTQATRSKRLIRLPARYKDSAISITGNELWNSPNFPSEETKPKVKRKLDYDENQNSAPKKICVSQNKKSKFQQNKTLIGLLENNSLLHEKFSVNDSQYSNNISTKNLTKSVHVQKFESVYINENLTQFSGFESKQIPCTKSENAVKLAKKDKLLNNNKNHYVTLKTNLDSLNSSLLKEKDDDSDCSVVLLESKEDTQFNQDNDTVHQCRLEDIQKVKLKNNSHIFIQDDKIKFGPVLYENKNNNDCKSLSSNTHTMVELSEVSNIKRTENVKNQNIQILNVTVPEIQDKVKHSATSETSNSATSLMLNVLVGNKIVPMKLVPYSVSSTKTVNSDQVVNTPFVLLPQTVPQLQKASCNLSLDQSNNVFNSSVPSVADMTKNIKESIKQNKEIENNRIHQENVSQNHHQNMNNSFTFHPTNQLNITSNAPYENTSNLLPNNYLNSTEAQISKNKFCILQMPIISQTTESNNGICSSPNYAFVGSKENKVPLSSNSLITNNSKMLYIKNNETVDKINSHVSRMQNQSNNIKLKENGEIEENTNHIANFHFSNDNRIQCNDNKILTNYKECKKFNKKTEIHNCNSCSSENLKSYRMRKQNKTCNLLCCNNDKNMITRCPFSKEEKTIQLHQTPQNLTPIDLVHSWSFSDKQNDTDSSEDNTKDKRIEETERRKNYNNLLDTLSSDHDSPSRETLEKYSTSTVLHTARNHVQQLRSTFHQLEKEKQQLQATKQNLLKKYVHLMNGMSGIETTLQEKIIKELKDKISFNNQEFIKVSDENAGKIMSMKFSNERLASLKSCRRDSSNKMAFKDNRDPKSKVDLNQLLAAAGEICGPCVVKRVQLKNGQTVYVYQPITEKNEHLESKSVESDSLQVKTLVSDNSDCTKETFILNENSTVPFSQLSGNILPVIEHQAVTPNCNEISIVEEDIDNNNSTTVWMTGNGEPCYVTKLYSEQNVEWTEDSPILCSRKETEDVPTIINCTSMNKEFKQPLGNIQSSVDEPVLNISQ